jgi:hypothetical protein
MTPMRRAPNRQCDRCGDTYYRCNRFRLWTVTNIGHRDGWGKVEQKLCCTCMDAADSRGVANLYLPDFPTVPRPKRRAT